MSTVQGIFHGVREYLTPVLNESSFQEKGVLTPEEFVAAGDQLIYKCPTWRWESGDPSKRRSYLPENKQYLVTKRVPCRCRVASLEVNYKEETEVEDDGDDDSWLATNATTMMKSAMEEEEIQDISAASNASMAPSVNILGSVIDEHFGSDSKPAAVVKEDEFADLASFEEDNLVEDSAAYVTAEEPEGDNIIRTRTYDLSISYDKYYQTPRVWLFGYNEEEQPLTHDEMFEDIMQDYANRTVTIEAHPHLDISHASIHPCQHAAVMKRIVDNLMAGGKEARTDQYLFIFLKFIQSVIPTIDYDYTMEVEGKS